MNDDLIIDNYGLLLYPADAAIAECLHLGDVWRHSLLEPDIANVHKHIVANCVFLETKLGNIQSYVHIEVGGHMYQWLQQESGDEIDTVKKDIHLAILLFEFLFSNELFALQSKLLQRKLMPIPHSDWDLIALIFPLHHNSETDLAATVLKEAPVQSANIAANLVQTMGESMTEQQGHV